MARHVPKKNQPLLNNKKKSWELPHRKRPGKSEGSKLSLHRTTGLQTGSYKFDARLLGLGNFKSTEHRKSFLYTLFDTGSYLRECRDCGKMTPDMVQHCLEECPGMQQNCRLHTMRMKFYNAPKRSDFKKKIDIFFLALTRDYYLNVLCVFLQATWRTD